ncbi:YibE/F family protein, partial [bacterium]|nr:YibE/F family protein [bacterium]
MRPFSKTIVFFVLFFFASAFFVPLFAAELITNTQTTMRARVLEIISEEKRPVLGTDVSTDYQTIQVEILDGDEKGEIITLENDYLSLKQGEVFYLLHTKNPAHGTDMYAVKDPYRLPAVMFFVVLFVLAVLVFGGIQGVRGLLALAGSFIFIIYLLFPGILHGFSPPLVAMGVSSLIVILGSYITHGFNKTTTSAVLGMIITIVITGALAYVAVKTSRLSGFSSEEAVYLNFNTRGAIDFPGLLLGGILIGLLGVLYDMAIGQAVSVEELSRADGGLSRGEVYKRAIRIGREHVGALVNTLAIAYVGVSLPLLLLFFSSSSVGPLETLNEEVFATEVIRIAIGSIGVILAVPITTSIAVWMLKKERT